jgi:hypothetical protein
MYSAVGAAIHAYDPFDVTSCSIKCNEMIQDRFKDFSAMTPKTGMVVLLAGHPPTVHAEIRDLRAWELDKADASFQIIFQRLYKDSGITSQGVDLRVGIENTVADHKHRAGSLHDVLLVRFEFHRIPTGAI